MRKNLEILDKIYNLRYKSGKVHLFYSINKLVGRFGNVVSLDKIYVSKDYLSYLSEKLFKETKERMLVLKENENEDITDEDVVLIKSYLSNWKKLQDKIKHFIPEEFYSQKINYFYTSLLSYVKFLEKLNPDYESGIKYLQAIN